MAKGIHQTSYFSHLISNLYFYSMSELAHLTGILEQMRKFCGYRDRCHREVRSKLLKLRVYGDDLEAVMSELIREDYLNEERFARSFARGKFRINHWGRRRITMELKRRDVSDYCIRRGLEEIDDEEYLAVIDDAIARKITDMADWATRKKVHDFLVRRGFEQPLVLERINRYVNSV
ncbi:MAG: regulatory protein RecX [Saprospiraceae bacterium]|nr:regulatory protein RecX [Saprospiraceae bacterium]